MADFNSGLGLTNDNGTNSGFGPSDSGNMPPPDTSNTGTGTSGGFNLSQYLPANLGGTGTGAAAMAIPALATAAQQWKDSSKYMDMVNGLKSTLDPFGSQRGQYQQIMSQAQADPAKYISSLPSYQAALQLGLGAVNQGSMSKTGGVPHSDDIAYASNLASQTWNNEMNRLGQLSGSQFGPQSLSSLYGMAIPASVNSQNAALQAMMYPFFAQNGPGGGGATGANTAPPGSGGGSPPGYSPGFNPGNIGTPGLNNTGGVGLSPDQLNYTGGSSGAGGGDYYDPSLTDPSYFDPSQLDPTLGIGG